MKQFLTGIMKITGKPARFGYSYSVTKLNLVTNHLSQHKFIGYKGKY
mgnify:CR=1 FL=1